MLNIHSIDTFSTQDGPGIRMVVFLQGCKFRCLYCHNPDTIPTGKGKDMPYDEIIKYVDNEKEYFKNGGGITFSGGEPTFQAKDLIGLCREFKKQNINICIDTNGYFLNDNVRELLGYVNLVILDIKHIDDKKHIALTSRSNKNTLEFLNYLEEIGKEYWIRHVLVPGYTNDPKDLETMGKLLGNKKYMKRFEFLPYHKLGIDKWKELGWEYGLGGVSEPSKEELKQAREIMKKHVSDPIIAGYTLPGINS